MKVILQILVKIYQIHSKKWISKRKKEKQESKDDFKFLN